jgi:hypothetical protein
MSNDQFFVFQDLQRAPHRIAGDAIGIAQLTLSREFVADTPAGRADFTAQKLAQSIGIAARGSAVSTIPRWIG